MFVCVCHCVCESIGKDHTSLFTLTQHFNFSAWLLAAPVRASRPSKEGLLSQIKDKSSGTHVIEGQEHDDLRLVK